MDRMDRMESLMTAREAAAYIGKAPGTLTQWRYLSIELPYYKIGGSVRYRRDDLDTYLDAHRIVPTNVPA
jgi:excisionase family DNA binding protein